MDSTRSIDGWVSKRVIPYIQITQRFYLYEFDAVLAALKNHPNIAPGCGRGSFLVLNLSFR
jgi:hypothetical protein